MVKLRDIVLVLSLTASACGIKDINCDETLARYVKMIQLNQTLANNLNEDIPWSFPVRKSDNVECIVKGLEMQTGYKPTIQKENEGLIHYKVIITPQPSTQKV